MIKSSYEIVRRATDKKAFIKKYGRKKAVRHKAITSNLKTPCLRRYLLSRGSRDAANQRWAYPPGQLIAAKPQVYFVVFISPRKPFASFIDVIEAVMFANSLRVFCSFDPKVYQIGG